MGFLSCLRGRGLERNPLALEPASSGGSFLDAVSRFCGRCGRARYSPEDRFCRACGMPYPDDTVEPPLLLAQTDAATPGEAQRQRPSWLVALLTLFTFGLYLVFWFGASWSEIKRERHDPSMRPFWHALTLFVPVYGLYRMHAHFQVLNALRFGRSMREIISPGMAVLFLIVFDVISSASTRPQPSGGAKMTLDLICAVSAMAITTFGQLGLNGYWRTFKAEGRLVPMRIHWVEWVTLGVGGAAFLLILTGLAAS